MNTIIVINEICQNIPKDLLCIILDYTHVFNKILKIPYTSNIMKCIVIDDSVYGHDMCNKSQYYMKLSSNKYGIVMNETTKIISAKYDIKYNTKTFPPIITIREEEVNLRQITGYGCSKITIKQNGDDFYLSGGYHNSSYTYVFKLDIFSKKCIYLCSLTATKIFIASKYIYGISPIISESPTSSKKYTTITGYSLESGEYIKSDLYLNDQEKIIDITDYFIYIHKKNESIIAITINTHKYVTIIPWKSWDIPKVSNHILYPLISTGLINAYSLT